MSTWDGIPPDDPPRHGAVDLAIATVRGIALVVVVFGCLGILLLVRLIEAPLFKTARPWTPHITMFVCRTAFRILGIRFRTHGRPLAPGAGAVVANHSSWLDIFALNAHQQVYFVSKSDVAQWPAIGWLARATGTVFIRRKSADAMKQRSQIETRLAADHLLLFFPEGTSSDGLRVLGFKSTLFAGLFSPAISSQLKIQPVSVVYAPPPNQPARVYGWWGDMDLAPHLLRVLALRGQGSLSVWYHDPVSIGDFKDRKALARHCHQVVRDKVILTRR